MYQLILQQAQLELVIDLMQQAKTCYLDTEFIRQITRHAQLALLQLNVSGQIFLIDPLNVDLKDFWQVLLQVEQVVFHSCNEDISLIDYHLKQQSHQCLEHIFDTQIGLEFLGYGLSVGYQSALEQCLSININKQETRSNWLARPLTVEQLRYAYYDVYYLPQLMKYVREQLENYSIYQYVIEDCHCLAREIAYEIPANQVYLQYARSWHSPRQLAQLQQITTWREDCSIKLNIPPSFVLKSDEILKLVQRQPKNEQEIAQLLQKNPLSPLSYATILKLLYKLPAKKDYPQRIKKEHHIPKQKMLDVEHLISQTAEQYHLPTQCLMRKKWLNDLYAFEPTLHQIDTLPAFLLGWRYDIITRPILQHLYGEIIGKQNAM